MQDRSGPPLQEVQIDIRVRTFADHAAGKAVGDHAGEQDHDEQVSDTCQHVLTPTAPFFAGRVHHLAD